MTVSSLIAGFEFVFTIALSWERLLLICLRYCSVARPPAAGLCERYSARRAERTWLPPGRLAAGFITLRAGAGPPHPDATRGANAPLGGDDFRAYDYCLRVFAPIWLSFLMLFVGGAVDNISVIVRHTLVRCSHR